MGVEYGERESVCMGVCMCMSECVSVSASCMGECVRERKNGSSMGKNSIVFHLGFLFYS